jgi:hypothetical protein
MDVCYLMLAPGADALRMGVYVLFNHRTCKVRRMRIYLLTMGHRKGTFRRQCMMCLSPSLRKPSSPFTEPPRLFPRALIFPYCQVP